MHSMYQRNIGLKLWSFRVLFFVITTICIYLFRSGKGDYGFVLAFFVVVSFIFPITDLIVSKEDVRVIQYFVFGLLPKSYYLVRGQQTELHHFEIEISDAGYTHAEDWWDLFLIFAPTKSIRSEKYILKQTDFDGGETRVRITLSAKECELIKEALL